jgi:hypothetical protein
MDQQRHYYSRQSKMYHVYGAEDVVVLLCQSVVIPT